MHDRWPIAVAGALMFLLSARAHAADPPTNWTGFYVGGHVGLFSGTTNFSDPDGTPIFGGDVLTPGFLAGAQVGYNWLLAPQWLAGLQADASILSAQGSNTCFQSGNSIIGSNCKVMPRSLATFTGRLGFLTDPHGRTLVYGKGGLAWMHSELGINPNAGFPTPPEPGGPTTLNVSAWGWTVGAGVEYAFAPAWSLFAEYDYLRFSGINVERPETASVDTTSTVSAVPSAVSSLTMSDHIVKIGVNYRWGVAARTDGTEGGPPPASVSAAPWMPGWEFDLGARYWYSSGRFQNSNGSPNVLVSRLSYVDMVGHSGEVFARLDAPFDVFVKGIAGGGFIADGKMYDEDWGHAVSETTPLGYSITQSDLSGSFNYFTGDIGYNVMRGGDHKVGFFVGYNRYQVVMSAMGCDQIANPGSGICSPATPTNVNGISELDTWQSLRVGTSAEVELWDRFKIGGDFAYLPIVVYDGLDIHHQRQPVVFFPVHGTGNGVQAELILSYRATDAFSIGVGGRYWALWTTDATQTNSPGNFFTSSTERYGVFVQASYKFLPH